MDNRNEHLQTVRNRALDSRIAVRVFIILAAAAVFCGCNGFQSPRFLNAREVVPPTLISAVISNNAPHQIVLTFSESVSLDEYSGWTVSGDKDEAISFTASDSIEYDAETRGPFGSGTAVVTLNMSRAAQQGETILLNYEGAAGTFGYVVSTSQNQPLLAILDYAVRAR